MKPNPLGDSVYPVRREVRGACERAKADFRERVMIIIVACVGWVQKILQKLLCMTS